MKKSFLLLPLALVLVVSSCKKDSTTADPSEIKVSTDQKAFLLKFSATWCGPCGAYAVPISQDIHTNFPYNSVSVHMQCGSSGTPDYTMPSNIKAPGHNQAQAAYNVTGIPTIIVGTNIVSTTYDAVSAAVSAFIATPATTAGIGLTKSISGTTMTINYKVKFFGDYADGVKLALYVVENDVAITSQAGNPSCKMLSDVFRGVPNGMDCWGTLLSSSAISKGTPFEGTQTYTLISDVKDPSKLEVVAVLYSLKMNGNVPASVINAGSTERH